MAMLEVQVYGGESCSNYSGRRDACGVALSLMGADLAAVGCQIRTHEENRGEVPQALRGQEERRPG